MVNKLNKSTWSQHAIIEQVIQRQEDIVMLCQSTTVCSYEVLSSVYLSLTVKEFTL